MKQYGSGGRVASRITPSADHPMADADRDLLQAHQPGYGSRSSVEVAFNLVNATVGAGIIGLPFALYNAGFIGGIVLSAMVSVISQLGLYMLIVAGQRVGIYKFAQLVEYLLGRPGYHFLNVMIFIQAGGASLSYLILIGDTLPVLFSMYLPQFEVMGNRAVVMALISIFLILPLNLSRSIGALARWSILSVLCLPVILLTLLLRAPVYATHEVPLTWVGPDLMGAVAIMAFGFACSQVAFNNFLALKEQTSRTWANVVALSATMTYMTSMSFAIIGYLCFGKDVQPNLFLNFPADDPIVNVGRFALGFSMILTVPMAFYPAREALQKLIGFETSEKQPTNAQHYVVTLLLTIVSILLGIRIHSVGKVYTVIGGFAATTLAYILPAIAYLYTRRRASSSNDETKPLLPATPGIPPPSPPTSALLQEDTPQLVLDTSPSTSTFRSSQSSRQSDQLDEDATLPVLVEDEPVTLDLDDGAPNRLLDLAAILLIIWGLVVMFYTIFAFFK
ncbi:hypothetical protein DM01DRAFT_1365317 [Hesseltinella vesiculosa]|uniref:Amino acid transporter transmembrane domain-containing protein n=1 Tax=Hesseltinella vesiculosa TaxID=101127 RepID=A0A1X2GYL8_9FUNG|nr:hypothetical protein DM01DRAFT_1365317 [Hesseltinella vesiculosa]